VEAWPRFGVLWSSVAAKNNREILIGLLDSLLHVARADPEHSSADVTRFLIIWASCLHALGKSANGKASYRVRIAPTVCTYDVVCVLRSDCAHAPTYIAG